MARARGPGKGQPVDQLKLAKLEKSLQLWKKLKAECKGNYTYSKRWSSWVGFGNVTEVIVANNKVVERNYKGSTLDSVIELVSQDGSKRNSIASQKFIKEGESANCGDRNYENVFTCSNFVHISCAK